MARQVHAAQAHPAEAPAEFRKHASMPTGIRKTEQINMEKTAQLLLIEALGVDSGIKHAYY